MGGGSVERLREFEGLCFFENILYFLWIKLIAPLVLALGPLLHHELLHPSPAEVILGDHLLFLHPHLSTSRSHLLHLFALIHHLLLLHDILALHFQDFLMPLLDFLPPDLSSNIFLQLTLLEGDFFLLAMAQYCTFYLQFSGMRCFGFEGDSLNYCDEYPGKEWSVRFCFADYWRYPLVLLFLLKLPLQFLLILKGQVVILGFHLPAALF